MYYYSQPKKWNYIQIKRLKNSTLQKFGYPFLSWKRNLCSLALHIPREYRHQATLVQNSSFFMKCPSIMEKLYQGSQCENIFQELLDSQPFFITSWWYFKNSSLILFFFFKQTWNNEFLNSIKCTKCLYKLLFWHTC